MTALGVTWRPLTCALTWNLRTYPSDVANWLCIIAATININIKYTVRQWRKWTVMTVGEPRVRRKQSVFLANKSHLMSWRHRVGRPAPVYGKSMHAVRVFEFGVDVRAFQTAWLDTFPLFYRRLSILQIVVTCMTMSGQTLWQTLAFSLSTQSTYARRSWAYEMKVVYFAYTLLSVTYQTAVAFVDAAGRSM